MFNIKVGLAGHAGIGHTHCPAGLVQDDSLGFTVASSIVKDILMADTRIKSLEVDPGDNTIRVTTEDGGTGCSSPRRGITPSEARLINGILGRDALFCHTLAIEALGRMYGQGVLETPAALAAALANSVLDTFHKKDPLGFHITKESLVTNSGLIGGLSTEINHVNTSIMITVNAASSGIGPAEDLEGNVALGSKRELMSKLGILKCPTIVLEGKAYFPSLSDSLQANTFLVRAQEGLDNTVVAQALCDSAKELGYPLIFLNDAFPRNDGMLKRKTAEFTEDLINTAERLRKADLASDKVSIVAELAKLVSQDAGGVSFMSNKLHDVVRMAGLIPGTSAVLSMVVTKEYLSQWKIPVLEQDDIKMVKNIVYNATPKIASNIDEAHELLNSLYVDLEILESLIM